MHDAARRAYAEELYAAGRAHDAGERDRLLRWRNAYVGYSPDLVRTLAPAGLPAVDNVISHAHDLVAFRATVDGDDRVMPAPIGTSAGVRLAVRQPA